jgi:hypothetical protein
LPLGPRPGKILTLRVYALTSSDVSGETLDLFLSREDAVAEFEEILRDEPGWREVLSVVPIERDERNVSPN